PTLEFFAADGSRCDRPLERTCDMLKAGGIVAVQGIGGFHLACDATREDVVEELRRRKKRPHKPLAIMVPDLRTCRQICEVNAGEQDLLNSSQSPIVLLGRKPGGPVAEGVAPKLNHLGVMLPYTPLHVLLFDDPGMPPALVMTSCNRAEEPIATEAAAVLGPLSDIVDGVLSHNRRITNRCDDSVVAVFGGRPLPMRRSRGYVPE
ncbi:unnamed protein product, partial [marine sediment metagenome]